MNLAELPLPLTMARFIIRIVQRLPDEVSRFVNTNCQFISIATNSGQTIYMKSKENQSRPWLIILFETKTHDVNFESGIAHEIAHAWLGHMDGPGLCSLEEKKQKEDAVCNLIKEWGFAGNGSEISRQLIPLR